MANLDPKSCLNLTKARVLLLDDHAEGGKMLSEIVRGFGVQHLLRTHSAAEAREIAAEAELHLILVNANLREARAFDFVRWLRHESGRNAFTPTILISGHIEAECVQALDAHLEELGRLCADAGGRPNDRFKGRIYDIANDVVGVAGVFQLAEVGEAAFCLCELVDRLRVQGRWNQGAVEVHVWALRLLRHPHVRSGGSAVIAGLRELTDRVTVVAE